MDLYNTIITLLLLPTVLLFMYMVFRMLDMMNKHMVNTSINDNDTYMIIDRISDLEYKVKKLKDQMNSKSK